MTKVREEDPHLPRTTLVAIENTHNKCGGRALPLTWLQELGRTCAELGLALHCDGARIFNAETSQGVTIGDLLQHVDSASICLSKVALIIHRLQNISLYIGRLGLISGYNLPCGKKMPATIWQ